MRQGAPDRAESIRHRLRNRVRARGEDVQFALQRYAVERFLYRLGRSPHRDRFILKGAMLFELWGGSVYRPTRDLDLTGWGSSDPDSIIGDLREVCDAVTGDGGIEFDTATFKGEPIHEETEYRGLRLRFRASLGDSRIPMQIDIGIGDTIEPPPLDVQYPTLLDDPPPTIRAYPREAVIAEKLHSMAVFDERNSRTRISMTSTSWPRTSGSKGHGWRARSRPLSSAAARSSPPISPWSLRRGSSRTKSARVSGAVTSRATACEAHQRTSIWSVSDF